jgi:hypothetical protein
VQIMGRQLGPDEVQALEIRVLDGGEGQPLLAWLIRIDGPPHASLWRVNHSDGPNLSPIFVAVNEETIIDETLGPAVPEAWLEIEATSQSPDFYTAQRITVLARAPKRQIVGEVQAMPDEGPYGRWEIDDYQVEVDSGTGIVGMPEMGSWVWVTGAPDLENVIYAEAIQVLGP